MEGLDEIWNAAERVVRRSVPVVMLASAALAAGAGSALGLDGRHAPAMGRSPEACPRAVLGALPAPSWTAARHVLVPRGATALRLCPYGGMPRPGGNTLVRSRLVATPALLANLTGEFDQLPPVPRFAGPRIRFTCTAIATTDLLLVLLAYPRGEHVTISVQPSPITCETATNGSLVRILNGPRR
jgi:hypothetical protein